MGSYAQAQIQINVNAVYRAGEKYGLPVPTPDDYAYFMTAAQVKTWMDFDGDLQGEAILVYAVLQRLASDYIYEKTLAAPVGRGRKDFLRKATKAFRVVFI